MSSSSRLTSPTGPAVSGDPRLSYQPTATTTRRRTSSIASIAGNLGAIPHPGDHRIANWQAAGLLKLSLAQAKIATVEASIIGRKLGMLSHADWDAFRRGLRQALAVE
jgi:hypothetical protein